MGKEKKTEKPDFKMAPEQKGLFDKLTPLQQKVCTNIIAGMSNIDAYMTANKKIKNKATGEANASRMLSDAKVKAFLDSMKEVAINDAIMSRQEMMERLSNFGRTNLHDLIEWAEMESESEEGEPIKQSVWMVKPSAMQDPNKMAAIAELNASKEGIKIKTHSQLAAMKQLAQLAGYESAQKHDHISSDRSMSPTGKSLDDFYKEADK